MGQSGNLDQSSTASKGVVVLTVGPKSKDRMWKVNREELSSRETSNITFASRKLSLFRLGRLLLRKTSGFGRTSCCFLYGVVGLE